MILVTGASGRFASAVLAGSGALGLDLHAGSRSPAADRFIDFDHERGLDLSAVDTLLLVSAGYAEDDVVIRRHGRVLAAARAQGVRHVVYTSLTGAGDHLGFALAHRWTERALRDSGLAWTILRNGLYAELIGALAAPRAGRIEAPFGTAGIAAVGRADLAAAALAVLADPPAHAGRCYELSAPTAFTVPDLARRLGVDYAPRTLAEERTRLAGLPLLPFQPPMLMSIHAATAAGFLVAGASDLGLLVPHPADALALAAATATG